VYVSFRALETLKLVLLYIVFLVLIVLHAGAWEKARTHEG
jgi:hypothetical protein